MRTSAGTKRTLKNHVHQWVGSTRPTTITMYILTISPYKFMLWILPGVPTRRCMCSSVHVWFHLKTVACACAHTGLPTRRDRRQYASQDTATRPHAELRWNALQHLAPPRTAPYPPCTDTQDVVDRVTVAPPCASLL